MSYKLLDHATDAIVEVTASDLKEAFLVVAEAVIDITLSRDSVREKEERRFSAQGKDLSYLLFSWLEELVFVMITDGFAIRRVSLELGESSIDAIAYGEPLDLGRHGFKVEIKAPTFHDMEIRTKDTVYMRFLLDL